MSRIGPASRSLKVIRLADRPTSGQNLTVWEMPNLPADVASVIFSIRSSHDSAALGVIIESHFDPLSLATPAWTAVQAGVTYSASAGLTTYEIQRIGVGMRVRFVNSANLPTTWEGEIRGHYQRKQFNGPPGPQGPTGPNGNMEIVSAQDVTAAPITWSSLTGDASTTAGYRILFRIRAGSAGTTFALRINNASGSGNYQYIRTLNAAGTVTGDATSANEIPLHGGTLTSGDLLTGIVDIPISGHSGTGFGIVHAVSWSATVHGGGSGLASLANGTGIQLADFTQLTRIDIVATAGSIVGTGGSRAILYRILKG